MGCGVRVDEWTMDRASQGVHSAAAKAFKPQGDVEALSFGSASIVHQLAPGSIIDEYRLMIYPIILGAGKRLYPDGAKSMMSLVECKQLGGGIVLLRYTTG